MRISRVKHQYIGYTTHPMRYIYAWSLCRAVCKPFRNFLHSFFISPEGFMRCLIQAWNFVIINCVYGILPSFSSLMMLEFNHLLIRSPVSAERHCCLLWRWLDCSCSHCLPFLPAVLSQGFLYQSVVGNVGWISNSCSATTAHETRVCLSTINGLRVVEHQRIVVGNAPWVVAVTTIVTFHSGSHYVIYSTSAVTSLTWYTSGACTYTWHRHWRIVVLCLCKHLVVLTYHLIRLLLHLIRVLILLDHMVLLLLLLSSTARSHRVATTTTSSILIVFSLLRLGTWHYSLLSVLREASSSLSSKRLFAG